MKGTSKVPAAKPLVLIVDDFKDDREMYSYYLSRSGFRVSSASDGQEGLDKAFQLLPDVILMDLWLPHIGGWEAIRQLKASEKTKHIPIVVLTARAFVSATAVGSDGCLIKPCQPDDLLVEVVRVLEKRNKGTDPASSQQVSPHVP
jgi:two-component system, cell cycle response regulator DivK